MGETVGVLVMAYGTPATPDDVEAYYTHVRRGRPPTPELLADLQRRYAAIGGTSPLLEVTRRQAAGLQAELGDGFRVELGMKHAPPFIEDGVAALATRGEARRRARARAPLLGDERRRVRDARRGRRRRRAVVGRARLPRPAGRCRQAGPRRAFPEGSEVVFTAHSLPQRILETGDPYPDQLRATAEAVAARAGLARWSLAWQSAGRTPDPWLGPDILEVLDDRAAAGRAGVLVCPCGFVSEHLEILYDLDVEARARADALALPFARTAMPNDDPAFLRRPRRRGPRPARPPRDLPAPRDAGAASCPGASPGRARRRGRRWHHRAGDRALPEVEARARGDRGRRRATAPAGRSAPTTWRACPSRRGPTRSSRACPGPPTSAVSWASATR